MKGKLEKIFQNIEHKEMERNEEISLRGSDNENPRKRKRITWQCGWRGGILKKIQENPMYLKDITLI